MKVAVPLAKNILASLGITAVVSTIGPGIHGSGKKKFNNFKQKNGWHNKNCPSP